MPEPAMGLTRELAAFIADLDPSRLPRPAIDTVTRGLADCVGVMFAGRDEPVAALAVGMVHVAVSAEAGGRSSERVWIIHERSFKSSRGG